MARALHKNNQLNTLSGTLYDPASPQRFFARWESKSFLLKRAGEIKGWLLALTVLTILTSVAISFKIERLYQASISVQGITREWSESTLQSPLLGRNTHSFSQENLRITTTPALHTALVSAQAGSPAAAQALAMNVALSIISREHTEWLKKPPLSAPASFGTVTNISQPQYMLQAQQPNRTRLIQLIGGYLIFAVLLIALAPRLKSRLQSKQSAIDARHSELYRFASAPKTGVEGTIRLETVASITLNPTLFRDEALPEYRPILSNYDSILWADLTNIFGDLRAPRTELAGTFGREALLTHASPASAVGSRTAALALGRAIARMGASVALIDCDFSAAGPQRFEFGFPETVPGMTDMLGGRCSLEDCVLIDDDVPGLAAIGLGTGAVVSHAMTEEILRSPVFLNILDEIAAISAIILIHGPDAKAAVSLSHRVSAALVVYSKEDSVPKDLVDAAQAIAGGGADVLGLIEICPAV